MRRQTALYSFVVLALLHASAADGDTVAPSDIGESLSAPSLSTPVYGYVVWDPFALFHSQPIGSIVGPGQVSCPGHELTGNPLNPCPEGSRIEIRGSTFVARVDSADPRMAGWATIEGNVDWDSSGTGPEWGTFHRELDAGGTWEGSFTGSRRMGSPEECSNTTCWIEDIRLVARGTGGVVDGLHAMMTEHIVTYTLIKIASANQMVAYFTGRPQ